MSAKSESSVLEQLKELVKANGNQAAAILDAVIEVLSQGGGGGTVIPGEAGQILKSDGQGGCAADSKVRINEYEEFEVVRAFKSLSNAVFEAEFSVRQKDAFFGKEGIATGLVLFDTADPSKAYKVTITNGQLTATQM